MSEYLNSKEKPKGGFLFNLFVMTPAVLFSLFIGGAGVSLIFGGVAQRWAKPGTGAPAAGDPASTAPAAAAVANVAPAAAPSREKLMADGQTVYMTVCIACHQATGLGLPTIFPPVAGSDWVKAENPERLIAIVLHGLQGPIMLNGKPFTTMMAMPPQGPMLKDEQIAAALTFVRNSFGNSAAAVLPEQVAAVREQTKGRLAIWTAEELAKALPARGNPAPAP